MPTNTDTLQFTRDLDEEREDRLFSDGRRLQGASDIEILDELAMRHQPSNCDPADAQRALYLAKWRVVAVFKAADGEPRARAVELIERLNDAIDHLNALTDELESQDH